MSSPPEEPPAAGDGTPGEDAAGEGTPYRAQVAGAGAFDVTLHEEAGAFTLRPVEDEEASPSGAGAARAHAYRFEALGGGHFLLVAGQRSIPVTITEGTSAAVRVTIGGRTADVEVKGETALLLERFGIAEEAGAAEAEVRAPMPGLVVRVLVSEGDEVAAGDGLLVLEAMKMENELRAPAAGTVAALHTEEGASVDKGAVLVEIT